MKPIHNLSPCYFIAIFSIFVSFSLTTRLTAQCNEADFTFTFNGSNCEVECFPTYNGPGTIVSRLWTFAHPGPTGTAPSSSNYPHPIFKFPSIFVNYPAHITQLITILLPNGQTVTSSCTKDVIENCSAGSCSKAKTMYNIFDCTVMFGPGQLNNPIVFWDFGDGTTSTNSTPTHLYSTPGEYILSATDSNGWTCSQKIRVGACNNNCCSAAFTGQVVNELCNVLNLVLISDCNFGVHNWIVNSNSPNLCLEIVDFNPSLPSQMCQITNVNTALTSGLTITHEVTCPNGTVLTETKTVSLQNNGIYIGYKNGGTSSLNQLTCLFSGNSYNGTENVNITGLLNIDKDFKFGNTRILMDKGAGINVQSGFDLTLEESTHIKTPCDCLWRGINVSNGAILRTRSNTIIEDGLFAVRPLSGGLIDILDTYFKKNYVAIRATESSCGVVGFEHNEIDGTGPLKQLCNLTSDAPFAYNPEIGYAGLWLNKQLNFKLSTLSKARQNHFHHLAVGIDCFESNLEIVKNAYFDNIIDIPIYGFVYEGSSIRFTDSPVGGGNTLNFIGNGISSPDYDFNNCGRAFYVEDYDVSATKINISDCRMLNLSMGVYFPADHKIIGNLLQPVFQGIQRNYMQINKPSSNLANGGVYIFHFYPSQACDLEISNNIIDVDVNSFSVRPGININSIKLTPPVFNQTEFEISGNEIHIVNGTQGIYATGSAKVSINNNGPSSGNPNAGIFVQDNTFATAVTGIALVNGSGDIVACNDVHSTATTNDSRVLYTSGHSNGKIIRNNFSGSYNGVVFFGKCYNSKFRCNTISNSSNFGLLLTQGAEIGEQGVLNTESYGNKWLGTFTLGASADASVVVVNSRFDVRNLPDEVPTLVNNPNWFFSTVPVGSEPSCEQDCEEYFSPNPDPDEISSFDMAIATNQLQYAWYPAANKWLNEKYLFEKLHFHPALKSANSTTQSFYDGFEQSGMARLIKANASVGHLFEIPANKKAELSNVEGLIAPFKNALQLADSDLNGSIGPGSQFDVLLDNRNGLVTAIDSLQAIQDSLTIQIEAERMANWQTLKPLIVNITPSNIFEAHEKTILQVYANAIFEHIKPDSAQLNVLRAIAAQCEFEGGSAVYNARGLYNWFTNIQLPDIDCSFDANERTTIDKLKSTVDLSGDVQLYPNPAGSTVTITKRFGDEEQTGMRVDFVNQLGQIAKQVSATENQFTVDVSDLMDGYYFVRVVQSGQIICMPLHINK